MRAEALSRRAALLGAALAHQPARLTPPLDQRTIGSDHRQVRSVIKLVRPCPRRLSLSRRSGAAANTGSAAPVAARAFLD
jgi:hypothetical protein